MSSNKRITLQANTLRYVMLEEVVTDTDADDDVRTRLQIVSRIPSSIVVDSVGQFATVTCHLTTASSSLSSEKNCKISVFSKFN